MPALAHTSVPAWAVAHDPSGASTPPDTGGTSYLLVAVGRTAAPVVRRWAADLAGTADVRTIEAPDTRTAEEALSAALAVARVGVRVRLAGPSGACLVLRGAAVRAGLQDDELSVAPTSTGPVELHCVHCGGVTHTDVGVGAVVPCADCDRSLLVYHHVSRRTGRFLGYMVDAEAAGA